VRTPERKALSLTIPPTLLALADEAMSEKALPLLALFGHWPTRLRCPDIGVKRTFIR
jgi:hypothetical protein